VALAEGAAVRRGDPLFVIDRRPYEAEVARAEAELDCDSDGEPSGYSDLR
jgi:multidrug resistance efflux pump